MTFEEFAPMMRRRGSFLNFHLAERGFIYAIICSNRVCKVGASTNPVMRIRAQIGQRRELRNNSLLRGKNRVVEILISDELPKFRDRERLIHLGLARFRFGRADRAETFRLPAEVEGNLKNIFAEKFSEASLLQLSLSVVRPPAVCISPGPQSRKRITATISISADCHPDHSAAVRNRMKERRARNYSHFVETLVAEDTGLIPKLQEAAA